MAVSGRESPSEQHYSLKWNDYSVKLVTAFQSLRDEEDFVDVTVACDGHQYSAHKMVLSACSPYFRSMLRANPCQHPIVILKDVGHNEMERLLEFMYNGEVNIAQDQLAAFLRTAENLKIRGLAGSSDDMEQIYNRDYGNMSTSDKLFNQQQQQQQQLQQQQQNSTSVSAIASTNTSINNSSGPHNEHNHQGLNGNNGFAKEESDGLSLSGGGGLSVPTTDCYSPAPKKRKLVMLNNTDQDCITDGEAALDGGGDANSVAALVSQAGPLGVEVKCLSRDLKAEPCEAGTEAGLTAGGEAVYSSSAGGDDTASQDQILAPHLYTIGVGGSTGASGGATHQDLNSAAQHNDQGGVSEAAQRGRDCASQETTASATNTAEDTSSAAHGCIGSRDSTSVAAAGAEQPRSASVDSSKGRRCVNGRGGGHSSSCYTATDAGRGSAEDCVRGESGTSHDNLALGLSSYLYSEVTIKKEEVEDYISVCDENDGGQLASNDGSECGLGGNSGSKTPCLKGNELTVLHKQLTGPVKECESKEKPWLSLVQHQLAKKSVIGFTSPSGNTVKRTISHSSSKAMGKKAMNVGTRRRKSQPRGSALAGSNLNVSNSRTAGVNTPSNAFMLPMKKVVSPTQPSTSSSRFPPAADFVLFKHSLNALLTPPKPYQCQLCPKSFRTRTTLTRHGRMHSGTALACPECGKLFYQKSNLNYHVSAIHGSPLAKSNPLVEPRP